MTPRFRILVLVTFVFGLLATNFSLPSPASAVPAAYTNLRTDGETIVWEFSRDDQRDVIWITEGHIWDSMEGVGDPDVSGDRIVWIGANDKLGGVSLSTGDPLDLPSAAGPDARDRHPVLDGDLLVWLNQPNATAPWRMLTVDLSEAAEPTVVATLPDDIAKDQGAPTLRPEISGGRIIWAFEYGEPYNEAANADYRWELWTATIGADPVQITSGTDSSLTGYDIGGTMVVYGVDSNIVIADVGSPESTQVLSQTGRDPTTDGRYVFWSWGDGPEENVYGYYLITDSYLGGLPKGTDDRNTAARARGGLIAWAHYHIHSAAVPSIEFREIRHILPSAPQPDPGKTDPKWLYFDSTGHYLSYGFKDFWLKSGGLPVFGYPRTREFDELNRDLGEFRTVQYTERQRFEYHPAYAGTPYETSLGRLGAADAERRGLLDHDAFQRVGDPATAGVDYSVATGHTLRGPFRDYWHSHGLEFGDPGISYRESLALFGYPISEVFVDPYFGRTIQYFERAVFEYFPDNSDPYQVQLRLLGAEEIERRGW
jgi:hypothetical protein